MIESDVRAFITWEGGLCVVMVF